MSVGQATSYPTEIRIHLVDYDAKKHKNYIKLTIENGVLPIEEQLRISDDGTVEYVFLNNKKREIKLKHEHFPISLIVSPNEKLAVDLKISEWNDFYKFKDFAIAGTNKHTNRLIVENGFFVDSLAQIEVAASDYDMSSIEYKKTRLDRLKRHLGILARYVEREKIEDKTFINWANAQLKYRAGYELSNHPSDSGSNRQMSADDAYFDFVKQIEHESSDELSYLSYFIYKEALSYSYEILCNVSDKYKSERAKQKKGYNPNFPIFFDVMEHLPNEEERNLLMAFNYKRTKNIPKPYLDKISDQIGEKLFSQITASKQETKAETVASLIKRFGMSDVEKKQLLDIYKAAEGKTVFHDFWFAKCAPCMGEMPKYNDIISAVGDDAIFVFYGVNMSKEEWMKTRAKFNVNGQHYLLSKNQLAFFERYFGVRNFPSHKFINSKGIFVDYNARNVTVQNIKWTIADVEKPEL